MNDKSYTVIFEGDIREMGKNLFQIISPFGEVIGCGVGNAFAKNDRLRAAIEGMINLAEAANLMDDPAYIKARSEMEKIND